MSGAPDAALARALLRRARAASLATSRDGWAFASLVTVAADSAGRPLLLLSSLADHSRNIAGDARVSLLVDEARNLPNPQTGPRATLMGSLRKTRDAGHRARFLARHPRAAQYADFADFDFYRLAVERVHFVGGFARARWLGGRAYLLPAGDIARAEPDLLAAANAITGLAAALARELLGQRGKSWIFIGADGDGADLRCGARFRRLGFEKTAVDGEAWMARIDALNRARK